MKRTYFIIGFLLWSVNSLSMERIVTTNSQEAGLFDLLSEDIRRPLFASLQPNQINLLRKSCKPLSEFFSFHDPSLQFLSCKNPYICRKDLESLFIVSVYDKKHAHAKILFDLLQPSPTHYYKLPALSAGLFAYSIAEQNKDKEMMGILKDLNHDGCLWDEERNEGITFYAPSSMLIACVSRNNERIETEIKETKKINEIELSLWLHIVIKNKDNKSLQAILQNIQISDDIKKMGNPLIELAYADWNSRAVKIILHFGCYDDLNAITVRSLPCTVHSNGIVDYTKSFQSKTLLDRILDKYNDPNWITNPNSIIKPKVSEIYRLLREKGAKTAVEIIKEKKEKELQEKCSAQ